MEYISREDYCEENCGKENREGYKTCKNCSMLNIPSTDVQPIRHGRWTYPYKDKDINQCSECRSCVQDKISNVREMFAYCPFCGARMDGEQHG